MANRAAPPLPAPAPPPLVGREREQAALRVGIASAMSGRGSLILIGGEAGIGKTTLAEFICDEAVVSGRVSVLIGRCYDLAETPPYGPWAEAFDRAPRDPGLPLLPAALTGDGASDGTESQAALFRQTRDFLAALASRCPLILLLEDLHWADQPSLDLLRTLGRDLDDAPLIILATYRVEEVSRRRPLYTMLPDLVREARATRLDLRPLDAGGLRALVRLTYPLLPSDEDRLVAHLGARTEGNPLYAGELLRALTETGVLRATGQPWQRTAGDGAAWALGDLAKVDLPPLLRQVIDARVDRLGEGARAFLAVAAVIGQEVPLGLWGAVAGADEEALATAIEAATEARLLIEEGDSVRFGHALIREALYAGLPVLRRRAIHRRVAEALLAAHGGGLSEPDTIASHLGRAGDPRELVWLIRAGERALANHAPEAAVDRLTRALDLAERQGLAPSSALRRTRGLARETLGDFAGALADLDAADAAARAGGDARAAWQAQLDLGQLWAARDYARTGAHFAQALALARARDDPAALAASLNRRGNWLLNTGQPVAGVAHHREALSILEALDDRPGMAETLDLLGMAQLIGTGEMAAAVRDLGRAADLLRALELPRQRSSALATRCSAAGLGVAEPVGGALWAPAACLRDAEEAIRLAEAADWAAGRVYAALQAGLALIAFGEFGRGLDYLGRGLDLATAIDHRQWIAAAHIFLGQAHVLFLAPGMACEHLQVALAMARDLGSAWWIAGSTTYLALAHLRDGDSAGAEAALAALLAPGDAALALGTLQERRLAWAWSEVRLAQGRPAEALVLDDALLADAPGVGPIPALLTVRGEALLALARHEEAARVLDDAVRGANAGYERPRLWRIHAARAALCHARGQQLEARRAVEDARAAIEDLAAAVPEGPLRDGFRRAALARIPDLVPIAPAPIGLPFGLTGREAEVLRLVARGLSNSAIADRLSLSRRTVEQHLRHAYDKLGVDNRTAAVRAVVERGLA